MIRFIGVILCGLAALSVFGGCAGDPKIRVVRAFNDARDRGDISAAMAMLAPEPRIWYEHPNGPGMPWTPGQGPWAGWDRFFGSSKRVLGEYQRDGDAVFAIVEETNRYYQLTERRWSRTMLTWFVTDDHRIRGMLVAGIGESPSRAAEFREWARQNHPSEYAHLFPSDQLDPSGDRPQRMKALLLKWRAAVGLPELTD
ncbi:MAG: hypothetical protein IT432_11990 [Phycisphaerales bacterium]|nr:hypothetical protein [Phycisphaerales bacterium]